MTEKGGVAVLRGAHGFKTQRGLGAAAALRVKQQAATLAQLHPFGVTPGSCLHRGNGVAGSAYRNGEANIDAHSAA